MTGGEGVGDCGGIDPSGNNQELQTYIPRYSPSYYVIRSAFPSLADLASHARGFRMVWAQQEISYGTVRVYLDIWLGIGQEILHGTGLAENFAWYGYCRKLCMVWVLQKILHGMGIAEEFVWNGYCWRFCMVWVLQKILHGMVIAEDIAKGGTNRRYYTL